MRTPARFFVFRGQGIESFSVDAEDGRENEFEIERTEPGLGERITKIALGVAKDRRIAPGPRRLMLRAIPDSGPPAIVTVDVRQED